MLLMICAGVPEVDPFCWTRPCVFFSFSTCRCVSVQPFQQGTFKKRRVQYFSFFFLFFGFLFCGVFCIMAVVALQMLCAMVAGFNVLHNAFPTPIDVLKR